MCGCNKTNKNVINNSLKNQGRIVTNSVKKVNNNANTLKVQQNNTPRNTQQRKIVEAKRRNAIRDRLGR